MTTEHKAEMVASMIESIVKFGLTPSEIDVFINALDDLRDSLDTNLHEKLKEAMASPIARVIADPRDTQIRELTAELDALRREVEVGKPKWIPIPQMPSDEGLLYLLTVLESYSMKTGIAIRKLCKDDDGEVYFPFSAGKVLAWQPLPEPYTEAK